MPRILLSLLLSFPFIGFAQQASQQTDSAIVSQLNLDWIASYAKRDTTTMQRILADGLHPFFDNIKRPDHERAKLLLGLVCKKEWGLAGGLRSRDDA